MHNKTLENTSIGTVLVDYPDTDIFAFSESNYSKEGIEYTIFSSNSDKDVQQVNFDDL